MTKDDIQKKLITSVDHLDLIYIEAHISRINDDLITIEHDHKESSCITFADNNLIMTFFYEDSLHHRIIPYKDIKDTKVTSNRIEIFTEKGKVVVN